MKKYLFVGSLLLILALPLITSAATVTMNVTCTCPLSGAALASYDASKNQTIAAIKSNAENCFNFTGSQSQFSCTGTIGEAPMNWSTTPASIEVDIPELQILFDSEQQKADAAEALLSAASEGLAGSATEGVTSGAGEGTDSGAAEGSTSGASEAQVVDKLPNLLAKNASDTASTNPNVIFGRIIQFIVGLSGSFALLMFVYGGLMWLLSRGQQEYIAKGKNAIKFAVLGLVIIATSYIIVKLIITAVGAIS